MLPYFHYHLIFDIQVNQLLKNKTLHLSNCWWKKGILINNIINKKNNADDKWSEESNNNETHDKRFCMTHPNRLNELLKQLYWMWNLQRLHNVALLCAILIFSSCYLFSLAASSSSCSLLWEGGSGQQQQGRQRALVQRAWEAWALERTQCWRPLMAWPHRALPEGQRTEARWKTTWEIDLKLALKTDCFPTVNV